MEQGAHLLTKGTLAEALKVAEASWVEALALKEKAKGESHWAAPLVLFVFLASRLEKEASRAAEASRVEVQR